MDTKQEIMDSLWSKALLLTVEIEYAKGYQKKYLLGKYDAIKEVWDGLKENKVGDLK